MHEASVLFSEPGLAIARPDLDALFVEDFVYTAGLQEEYAIAAYYSRDPARKDRGHAACNWLALSRDVPPGTRELARANLFFYIEPASAILPSFAARPLRFTLPEGFRPRGASVSRRGEQIMLLLEAVNYAIGSVESEAEIKQLVAAREAAAAQREKWRLARVAAFLAAQQTG